MGYQIDICAPYIYVIWTVGTFAQSLWGLVFYADFTLVLSKIPKQSLDSESSLKKLDLCFLARDTLGKDFSPTNKVVKAKGGGFTLNPFMFCPVIPFFGVLSVDSWGAHSVKGGRVIPQHQLNHFAVQGKSWETVRCGNTFLKTLRGWTPHKDAEGNAKKKKNVTVVM